MVRGMAMRGRARANRAARRRAKRTLENAAARERATEAAVDEEEARPRIARHVDWLDHLLMKDAITEDMCRAGSRFARDFERSMTVIGRQVGPYAPDLIRRPGWQGPPDTPGAIRARERFEAASDRLGPLWAVVFHVAVTDQPPESWGVQAGYRNGDALALLRLGLAALVQHYGGARAGRASRPPHNSAAGPAAAALL
jgi:hypothetical protein